MPVIVLRFSPSLAQHLVTGNRNSRQWHCTYLPHQQKPKALHLHSTRVYYTNIIKLHYLRLFYVLININPPKRAVFKALGNWPPWPIFCPLGNCNHTHLIVTFNNYHLITSCHILSIGLDVSVGADCRLIIILIITLRISFSIGNWDHNKALAST